MFPLERSIGKFCVGKHWQ